jgi:predicted signal transduction protein with EAL and GGDEF domain
MIRSSDTLSRFGGDEFVLMMPKYHRTQVPEMIARAIIDNLEQPFQIKDQSVFISASIGIAIYPQDGVDSSELLRNADAAMYQAKGSGRRSFAFFHPQMNTDAKRRISLEAELRRAISDQQLRVFYQPIFTAGTREVSSVEALVRWEHPQLGLLPPSDFIPYAEEVGLIDPITTAILSTVCEHLTKWRGKYSPYLQICVNFSPRHFHLSSIQKLFHDMNVSLDGLIVEVTESLLMNAKDIRVTDNLHWLKKHGALIALDDFGTGYSSLSYIHRYPVDLIKIDRSFVIDAPQDQRDEALVRATIAMAHGVSAVVVAEGVDNIDQEKLMIKLGADRIQGYLLAKPMPTDEIEQFFAHCDWPLGSANLKQIEGTSAGELPQ